eukprot:363276-Chlamydomonas_euryale.AAC.12
MQHFYHAVIFLLEHDDRKGSIGIILNRPTKFSLGEVSVTGQEVCPAWIDQREGIEGNSSGCLPRCLIIADPTMCMTYDRRLARPHAS